MGKLRGSTKICIGFLAIVGGGWFAFNKLQDVLIMGEKFAPITPGKVNIVGVTPNGYRIIISNEVAQLVETQGDFQADQSDQNDSSDSGGAVKKKISMKDMLGVLQGDSNSLSAFLMSMNDINENDLPPIRVPWTKEDVAKALAGDPALVKKLESDIDMKLDGTPLSAVSAHSIQDGIVLQIPVTVQVLVNGAVKPVTGIIQYPYKPPMIKTVEADVASDAGTISATTYAGYYKQEAEKMISKGRHDDIVKSLKDMFSDAQAKTYQAYPEKILKTAFVVVNDSFIDDATYSTYANANGKPLYDLHLSLNNEGRKRLWQYSRQRVGDQILLTSNGVAIAAARIQHPLIGGDVTINHMSDQTMLDDLIANLKSSKGGKVARK